MNRRKFLQSLLALPFAGALLSKLVDEAEAAPVDLPLVIESQWCVDGQWSSEGVGEPAEIVYVDISEPGTAFGRVFAGKNIKAADLVSVSHLDGKAKLWSADDSGFTILGLALRDFDIGEEIKYPIYPNRATADIATRATIREFAFDLDKGDGVFQ